MGEQKTILLVEDNVNLNEINRRELEAEGYAVLTAFTLEDARVRLKSHDPDVILLDVRLPDGDGIDFCGEIREVTTAHILFLTSSIEDEDKVRGLDSGGDDYITKPYKLKEMLSRVRAAMRRRDMEAVKSPARTSITLGPLTLDVVTSEAHFDNKENMRLTPKEFAVLLLMVQNEGRTLTNAQIYEGVWKKSLNDDPGALLRHISSINKKLEESGGAASLVNVRGKGYMLEIEK